MKKIGIIAAMALEIRIIKEHLVIAGTDNFAGFTFITGSLNGKMVVLTISGIGKVNAAICAQLMIDHYDVECIINTGIANGIAPDLRTCDVVISEDVTYHDVRPEQMISCFPNKEVFTADQKMIDYAIHACDLTRTENWEYRVGRIVSGEQFVSGVRKKKQIIQQYKAQCVDMEGAAIGHVAHVNRVQFVIIRSISDSANRDASLDYQTFEKVSSNISSNIVIQMIHLMGEY